MRYLLFLFLSVFLLFAACQQTTDPATGSSNVVLTDSVPLTPKAQLNALHLQIAENPANFRLLEERSEVYYQLDSLKQAIRDVEAAIELNQLEPDLHYRRGFYAGIEGDTALSIQSYERAIEMGTENPNVHYQLGQIYFFKRNEELALRYYQQAEDLAPKQPIYRFAQGFLEENRRRHSLAVGHYLESLKKDSSFAKSLIQLHNVYFTHYGNEQEAMKYIQQLIEYRPGHALGRFYQGDYHMRQALAVVSNAQSDLYQQQINDAVLNYTVTVNKSPNFLQARYNRGFCYFLAQNLDPAIVDFEACLKLDEQHLPSLLMLGDIYAKSGDPQSAKAFYEKAAQSDPDNPDPIQKLKDLEGNG
ncbi:MAG: tetratricopeptide repeat protein [Bacteroidota bacterium]